MDAASDRLDMRGSNPERAGWRRGRASWPGTFTRGRSTGVLGVVAEEARRTDAAIP
jgi:hypothetical protein